MSRASRIALAILLAMFIAVLIHHFSARSKSDVTTPIATTEQTPTIRPSSPAPQNVTPVIQSPDLPRPESIKASANAAESAAQAAARIAAGK
jgi:hypothetical protein